MMDAHDDAVECRGVGSVGIRASIAARSDIALPLTCGGAAFLTSFFTVPNDGNLGADGSDAFDGGFGAAFFTSFSTFLRTCGHGDGDAGNDQMWLEQIRARLRQDMHARNACMQTRLSVAIA